MPAPVLTITPRQLARDPRRRFRELAKAGGLVWVDTGRQRFLVVSSPGYVQEMLIGQGERVAKPDSQLIETGPPAKASSDDGIPVQPLRQALARVMGPRQSPDVLSGICAAAHAERARWREGLAFPLVPAMRRLAINAACQASFASRLDADEVERAAAAMARIEDASPLVKAPHVLRHDRWSGRQRRRREAFLELSSLSESLIRNADRTRPSELSVTLDELPALAPELPAAALAQVLVELFLGAVSPLKQTAAWAFVHLAPRDLRVAQELRAEWEAVLSDDNVDKDDLARLRYTQAFVRELTRFHPTNEHITRQALADLELGGEVVPSLTRIILNVPALHHDPASYPDPDRFWPERWLEGRPSPHKFAYVAFGVGNRRCLGETVALTSLSALLPLLARDWDLVPGRLRLARGARNQPAETMLVTLRRPGC